jgi:hypothetical protein
MDRSSGPSLRFRSKRAPIAGYSLTGNVYNLEKLSDFEGNYVAATAGLTIAGGGSAAYLNEHGVVIKLSSSTVGLRFNLAVADLTSR